MDFSKLGLNAKINSARIKFLNRIQCENDKEDENLPSIKYLNSLKNSILQDENLTKDKRDAEIVAEEVNVAPETVVPEQDVQECQDLKKEDQVLDAPVENERSSIIAKNLALAAQFDLDDEDYEDENLINFLTQATDSNGDLPSTEPPEAAEASPVEVQTPPASVEIDVQTQPDLYMESKLHSSFINAYKFYQQTAEDYKANMKTVETFRAQNAELLKSQEIKIRKIYSQICNDPDIVRRKVQEFEQVLNSSKNQEHLYILYDFMGTYLFKQIQHLGPISPDISHQRGFAKVLAALTKSKTKLMDFLFYHFHSKCPYTIPIFPQKKPNQSDSEYRIKELMFTPNETEIQYKDRMEAIMYFFGALNTERLKNYKSELDLNHCWAWFARTMNQYDYVKDNKLLSELIPLLVKAMIIECGDTLLKVRSGAATKLFSFLQEKYIKTFRPDEQQRTQFTLDDLYNKRW